MTANTTIQKLFEAGAHFGYTRTRRNPTVQSFIFGQKNRNDIFDLELTAAKLEEAKKAAADVVGKGKSILFVAGKNEARIIMRRAAEKADEPFVCGRWIGGTLTNFKEISKRVKRLETLQSDKEKGNLDKYTKKERLLIDREIEDLEATFGGIVSMKELPGAMFVVDPRHEEIAVNEAKVVGVPVIALANSDCDLTNIAHPIPANDATNKSITFFANEIIAAIEEGKKAAKK
ncbi:30S ribosomal protein S2 [bacterium]|nr:30S ribosomal protein S2 [bacterium]|tara:strand:+ start:13758 stop:14453 length:696 start_codon:yes stop_codon:yes gene_type:complete